MDESDPGVDPLLRGGIGGAGGWGDITGGVGGLGEAAELAIQQVDFFGKIVGKLSDVRFRGGSMILSSFSLKGGLGGAGGAAINFGGDGGRGKGNKFSGPLLSIDNETRRRFPTKVLKDFEIKPQHRQLLQKQGFQTAGGLFEVSKNDLLELHFKIGDISQLTVALNKLVANSKRLKA
ncbi:hypothetical protein B0H11DRAFT_324437 [Mycena galericulata]|nr:hypothetical protein B0H11DRAFT_324437 [Mycena galericulata]